MSLHTFTLLFMMQNAPVLWVVFLPEDLFSFKPNSYNDIKYVVT